MSTNNKKIKKPVGYKIRLNPSAKDIEIFIKYFRCTDFIYNKGVELYNSNRDEKGRIKQIPFYTLTNHLQILKEQYTWLNDYSLHSLRIAMRDVHEAVNSYFMLPSRYNEPRFKYKKAYTNHMSFGVRGDRLVITKKDVKISSIGEIPVKDKVPPEVIGYGNKDAFTLPGRYIDYIDSRIIFDGINYYLVFSINEDKENGVIINSNRRYRDNEIWNHKKHMEIIGLDFGCKDSNWIVSSNGDILEMPDLTAETKRIKKLQRKYNRQVAVNNARWKKLNPDIPTSQRPRTKNELETLKKWNILEKRKTNKKLNALYNFISHNILQYKPDAVVIEDIYTENMLQTDKSIPLHIRKKHNYDVMNAMPYRVKDSIQKTVSRNDIPVIVADIQYPSSQICSRCGNRTKIGASRTFVCSVCGLVIDRDENASLNLRNYGYNHYYKDNEKIG